MFKLANLFVEIQADKAPFDTAIAGVQAKSLATAASLGSSVGGIFSAMTGPVGVAFSAISGLLGLLDEENEDVAQLGAYWDEAIAPIKEVLEGVVHNVTEWITGLRDAAQNSILVKSAVEQFGIYAEAAFENAKVAVDQAVAVFIQLKAVAEDLFDTSQIWFEGFQADMKASFGGPALALITSWGSTIQTYVVDAIEMVGIAVRNWPDIFELAALMIQEKMMNVGEYVQILPQNLAIVGTYIAGNWKELIVDSVTAIGTVFQNLGANIGRVAYAIAEFIKNPTGGFKFEWTPLLDGFKATAQKLPELLRPQLTDMGDQFEAIANRIAEREKAGFEGHAKRDADAKKAADAAGGVTGDDKFKSQISSGADFAKRLTLSFLSGNADDTPKQSLDALKKIAVATEKLEAKMAIDNFVARLG